MGKTSVIRFTIVAAALAAGSLLAGAAAAPPPGWTSQGSLPGAEIDSIVFDPSNPRIALVGSNSGVVYRSTDQGVDWTPVQVGGPDDYFRAIGFAPSLGSKTVYAFSTNFDGSGTDTIYVSNDSGASWSPTATTPSGPYGPLYYGRGIAVETAGNTVVVSDHVQGIWRTTDGGGSWKNTLPGSTTNGGTNRPYGLVVDPGNSTKIWSAGYTVNANGSAQPAVWSSTNFGASWKLTRLTGLPSGSDGYGIAVQPGPEKIFVSYFYYDSATNAQVGGLVASTDGGLTFNNAGVGFDSLYNPGNAVGWMVFDPTSTNHILTGTNGDVGSDSLYESNDDGATWAGAGMRVPGGFPTFTMGQRPAKGSTTAALFVGSADLYAGGFQASSYPRSDAGMYATAASSVAADDLSSAGLYAVGQSGLFHSAGNGAPWTYMGTWSGVEALFGIAVDPVAPTHTLYAETDDERVQATSSGGASWTDVTPPGIGGTNFLAGVFTDPGKAGYAYATTSAQAFYTTKNAGATWHQSTLPGPINNFNEQSFAVSRNPEGTLYAVSNGQIETSINSGGTWAFSPVPPAGVVGSIAVQQAAPYEVLAGIDSAGSSTVSVSGAFASTDHGASWVSAPAFGTVPPNYYPLGIAVANGPNSAAILGQTSQYGYIFGGASCPISLDAGQTSSDPCLEFGSSVGLTTNIAGNDNVYLASGGGPIYSYAYSSLPAAAPSRLRPAAPSTRRRPGLQRRVPLQPR